MCGVFGYIGHPGSAAREVIAGLQRLEYRGYDSAGLCVIDHASNMQVIRAVGKVNNLKVKSDQHDFSTYHAGIGHTRWATHGGVTEANCHPHLSQSGRFVVIHNGIIENYSELKQELIEKGYTFNSETDTEVTVQLFEDIFDGDYLSTITKLVSRMHGAYGLVFLDRDNGNTMFGTKKGSPMVLGFGKTERYISSDYRSLIGLIDDYIILEDGDIFLLTPDNYQVLSEGLAADRIRQTVDESEKVAELGDFPNFMLKEVFEQPRVLEDVFRGRIDFDAYSLHSHTLAHIATLGIKRITVVASGTSYHSGLLGKYYLEELANIPVDVIVSTEFKYKKKFVSTDELYIFVSQSGETIDTLDSLKIVKEQGGHVFAIVNVPGSAIARAAGQGLFTRAGTEVGVASTKAFVSQVGCFLFLALYLGQKNGLDYRKYREIIDSIDKLPEAISDLLLQNEAIKQVAEKYAHSQNFFYLGRAHELVIAMEGSLKLKELAYIHSEAYSSGELKHGSIALIDAEFPSLMVNGGGILSPKNASSAEEIRARGGKVVGIIAKGDSNKHIYADTIEFNPLISELNPFLEVVILQLWAYHIANSLGRDVDKPRNLAKSVTVE
ncbi:glutamine--fructose-6-phosphate transaminase (isomerizing) [Candidatus Gracilibacteria bacterium]|nr:glutamine--fructose-6-phosphate transaminase (isomerizing) [Candidatus Gracilibacteria bacterium]